MPTYTQSTSTYVGRFAPSPSGRMHLGNAFSYLMAWCAARHAHGRMVLRIEDLGERASNNPYPQQIMDDLRWLGLTWDGEALWQSERTEAYLAAATTLAHDHALYPCFCTRANLHAAEAPHASDGTPIYQGTCANLTPAERICCREAIGRPPAWRMRVKRDAVVSFTDAVRGPQTINLSHSCGDIVVRRSDGVFAYQLAVVIDDIYQGVTQVVRGADLLDSAARQIYIARALNIPETQIPSYAHVPLLVDPRGRRLSKRDGDLELASLRALGARPERIIGYLAGLVGLVRLGVELSAHELAEQFSWDYISRAPEHVVIDQERALRDLLA